MLHMQWAHQSRGVWVALALSILGHAGIGFIWKMRVAPPAPWSENGVSGQVAAQAVTTVRFVSPGAGVEAVMDAVSRQQVTSQPSPSAPDRLLLDAFVPSAQLDRPLVPMSAPDTSLLEGLQFSGLPIRLRILVTAAGRVAEVLIVKAAPEDDDAVERIKAMLLATAYIPGRKDGKPVAAQLDMELQLDYLE